MSVAGNALLSGDTGPSGDTGASGARLAYLLRLADTSLILAQQLGALVGHGPSIEEDLGLANTALDLLGQARLLLSYVGQLEGAGRDEDQLAFLRDPADYLNVALAEQPNGDFAHTIVRQFLIDAWQLELYEELQRSRDERLAGIAAKALKETRFHLRYSSGWVVRLGDGTPESHARMLAALEALWPFTAELFDADAVEQAMIEQGIAPDPALIAPRWRGRVQAVLTEATLPMPEPAHFGWYGKRGQHNEHFGHVLTELQYMQRTYPGARW